MWKCPICQKTFKANHQNHFCSNVAKTIDEYIENQDQDVRSRLTEIRHILQLALPHAQEKISWGMPTYWEKENLIHFACSKRFISLYPGKEAVEFFKEELKEYETQKGTIHIFHHQELPSELIFQIAKWCEKN